MKVLILYRSCRWSLSHEAISPDFLADKPLIAMRAEIAGRFAISIATSTSIAASSSGGYDTFATWLGYSSTTLIVQPIRLFCYTALEL